MDAALVKKLLIRSGQRVAVFQAPAGFLERLSPMPEGATLESSPDKGSFDLILLFVPNKAALEQWAPAALSNLCAGGVLWLSYPKRSKTMQTDIHRDQGWDVMAAAGWAPVTQIAIDETWSALRFRPESDIVRQRKR